jgi:NADPH-dependent 7-cyano-7-deazaguanine reductase QueF
MKSLKLYFFSYRDKGIFYESVVNTILDDLVAVLRPRYMRVTGQFAVRGGTAGTVTAEHDGRKVGGQSALSRGSSRANGTRRGKPPATNGRGPSGR